MIENYKDSAISVLFRQKLGMRAIWLFIYYFVAQKLPSSPMPGSGVGLRLRKLCINKIFKFVGIDVTVHGGVDFGSGINVQIGDFSSLNSGCWIGNDSIIGRNVMMGPYVIILSSSHNYDRTDLPMREQGAPSRRPVIIGDDVWIGTRSIILPGIKVGSHSIIGCGCVVTKDVPEWAVVVGNPARVARYRNKRSAIVNSDTSY